MAEDISQCPARLAASEVKSPWLPEFCAATFPLECLRFIISSVVSPVAARTGNAYDVKFMARGVPRACFCAPSIRLVYGKVVNDDYEECVDF